MSYTTLELKVADGLATITLNRPQALNALSMQSLLDLKDAIKAINGSEARCVILTGRGRGFCTGVDLSEARQGLNPADEQEFLRDYFIPPYQLLAELDVPTIAAVNGPCAGAGVSLALTCDVVIAAESAYFLQPFVNIGLVPDLGSSWLLPHLVGKARAAGLMLLGDRLPAKQAAEWGLIWRCEPDDSFNAAVLASATQLAHGASVSHRLIKELLRQAFANDLPTQMRLERQLQAQALRTADAKEARRAFAEKRKPTFTGA